MAEPQPSHIRILSDAEARPEKGVYANEKDVESIYDEELPTRESDFKRRQTFKGWTLLWLAYQSTGVIYGDIGTSPLYVYSSTFSDNPSYDDLLGALSLIIWSLTLIVSTKYVFIVLRADDEGEGGTFAMYNLLSRYANIARHDPKKEKTVKLERYKSNDLRPTNRGVRNFIEKSRIAHTILQALAVFGVSMIIADGVLTPAQSVLGAIQGLRVVNENISTGTIIGVSCAILVLLFLVQPFGITKIGSTFAPVVIVWLLFNAAFGIYNLAVYDHSVLKAFSPYYAGLWFVRNKTSGWINLGGILLAFTGVEALFADLGAFSRRAVQLSWLCFAFPCLLLAYIGQAAYLSRKPEAWSNPFFETVPPGMFYPSLVIAILAAVVASQAMITSTFQLLSQVMNTSYFPQIRMIYTSEKFHGQVYIPIANWLLMVGTVIVTAVYNNTTSLGHAYGVCVIFVTFLTTNMVTIIATVVWRLHWAVVLPIWLVFVTLDGLYLSSALTKVPDGAWFTLLLAVILAAVFILWRYGKEQQWKSEEKGRMRMTQVVVKNDSGNYRLTDSFGGGDLTHIKGLAIFFDKGGDMVPQVFEEFLRKFEALPDVQALLHLRALSVPHVAEDEMVAVSQTSLRNCYRVMIRHGYNDHVVNADLGSLVYSHVRKYITKSAARPSPYSGSNAEAVSSASGVETPQEGTAPLEGSHARITSRLEAIDRAYLTQTVYIVGKEQLRVLPSNNNIFKRMLLGVFLFLRENTRTKVASLKIPVDKLVEVGFVKEL
ncbi:potassium uptake protein [Rhizodiscina lignyota]|uniref:Potassium uptake protein n=1 Tax=Rhizodiscina lignyota TaxID=1504668 RepID=A0A9P4IN92_9PEZI|nr:potassium uptake protein [Rhizodiscina lignyota]